MMPRFSTLTAAWRVHALARAVLVLTISGTVPACSGDTGRPPQALTASHEIIADVIVTVTNHTSRLKQIYLSAGQTRHTLGAVPERASRSFSVPSGAGDSTIALYMEASEAGSSDFQRSDAFHLASGQRAIWTIEGNGTGVLTMR